MTQKTKNILVASGKGGVGKSTIAANLALALSSTYKVGLIDADIHGPSIARMFGIEDEPEIVNQKMIPHKIDGIGMISMGCLLPAHAPVVWRGPMITKALNQLMVGADWSEYNMRVIDMPPGTGDIHLTICQKHPVDGVILITTPQEIAFLDVQKAASMYQKLNIPILGLIENMSYIDNNGTKLAPFGPSRLAEYAKHLGCPALISLPILSTVSENTKPAYLDKTNTGWIKDFDYIANNL